MNKDCNSHLTSSNEFSKLTAANLTSNSDPHSPSLIAYSSINTRENSKLTSQNKSNFNKSID